MQQQLALQRAPHHLRRERHLHLLGLAAQAGGGQARDHADVHIAVDAVAGAHVPGLGFGQQGALR